jgi:cobalt/nickel transport system ATP-binding protein
MSDTAIISLQGVAFAYAGRPPVLDGLDLALRPGDRLGLHGPNGAGKTTLLRVIMGLERPQAGRALFHGESIENAQTLLRLRRAVGLVLQNADDQLFSPTVLEDVAFGPLNLGLGRDEARARAMAVLESLDLADLADRLTHRLSGGEKKLVSLACVLSMRPEALLLDEPTAFLDDAARDRIIEILQGLPIARIVVSHDREFLKRTATSFARLEQGKLAACAL